VGCACGSRGRDKNAYEILLENRKGRDHLGPRHRWNNDSKKDITEIE
jgi:hypothetical protein